MPQPYGILLRTFGVFMTLLVSCALVAQDPSMRCDVLRFQYEDQPYIEVQIELDGSLLAAKMDTNGWYTSATVAVIAESNGQVIAFAKSEVKGPVESDSLSAIMGTQFHLERLELDAGQYRIAVELHDTSGSATLDAQVVMDVFLPQATTPHWSDAFILEAFAPSEPSTPTSISRSGYEMLPLVGARMGTGARHLQFYAELYGVNEVVDSLFLMTAWLENAQGEIQRSTQRFFRKSSNSTVPLFASVPLADVSWSEPLFLVLQAATRDNNVISERRLPLEIVKELAAPEPEGQLPDFIAAFTDSLTLLQHIKDHHPHADGSEQQTIDIYMPRATVLQMQGFLDHFWKAHRPENQELGWREYTTAIAYVDSIYGACRWGHGASTDMGYVYLRYGPPNTIVKRHNGTDYYPYEIWHYHRAGAFTNKRFLFFSPHMVSECFVLLHSDMLGEVQNTDWLHVLRNRENGLQVTQTQLNQLNPKRDTFSGEEPEDLFFNPR